MKFRLFFSGERAVSLPTQYKHILHASFLQWLQNEEIATFIHEDGYYAGKRVYKLYTISDILTHGKRNAKNGKVFFENGIELVISSFTSELDEAIINAIEEEHSLILGNISLYVEEYEEIEEKFCDCVVQTLSPITIHSSFELPDGSKKTYYYSPKEKGFSKMLCENIIRKYKSIYGIEPENMEFEIRPLEAGAMRKVVIRYKSTIVIGWKGKLELCGNPELIRIALLCGLGDRNSIGMGCVIQEELEYVDNL